VSVAARFVMGFSSLAPPAKAQIAATSTGNLATSDSMDTVAPLYEPARLV